MWTNNYTVSEFSDYLLGLKSPPAVEKSKTSAESSRVSISTDSMISTMRDEEGYPNGLKVLVVDEDLLFLEELKVMLQECDYTGTMCSSSSEALSMLGDKNHKFDIILLAINDTDEGFKQIQQLSMEADLPIRYLLPKETPLLPDIRTKIVRDVMGGNDASKMFKPISFRSVQCLWFPVAAKRLERLHKLVEAGIIDAWDRSIIKRLLYSRWGDDGSLRKLVTEIQKLEQEEDENYMDGKDEDHYTSVIMNRKPKIPWMASELQGQFVAAVYKLGGIEKADADKILQVMNFPPGLTRKDVDIHLKVLGGNPSSKMPFDIEAEPICSVSNGYIDDADLWRMV
ncbi:hypothetical protein MKW92_019515 [Papaver armeniacum]|nr:hypothetical protein MKW92_019515 [Papaver armeniacum]